MKKLTSCVKLLESTRRSLKLRVEPQSSKSKSESNHFTAVTCVVYAVTVTLVNNSLKHVSLVLPSTSNQEM